MGTLNNLGYRAEFSGFQSHMVLFVLLLTEQCMKKKATRLS